jgi:hypothetical protein
VPQPPGPVGFQPPNRSKVHHAVLGVRVTIDGFGTGYFNLAHE